MGTSFLYVNSTARKCNTVYINSAMNLVLLDDADVMVDGHARLRGPRARHIVEVHRAAVGDTLRVGLIGGLLGQGVVTALSTDEVVLSVQLGEAPPPSSGIDLLLALPRPKMLRRLLAAVASMGVKRLVLVNSARVEKSYFDSPLLTPAAIEAELRLGLSQARDTILPDVTIERRFRPFIEDRAELVWPAPTRRLVAHPAANRDLSQMMSEPDGPLESGTSADLRHDIVLAVGPEGGWVPFEVDLLNAHGFEPFTTGPRVLRVDTAIPFLLGQLALVRQQSRSVHP
jgi:RsmE family RNA methyltransferase